MLEYLVSIIVTHVACMYEGMYVSSRLCTLAVRGVEGKGKVKRKENNKTRDKAKVCKYLWI